LVSDPVDDGDMRKTSYEPGTPSWVDLGTADIEAAKAFYGGLFGWRVDELGPEAGGYCMAFLDDAPVAGLGPQQNPGPPYWTTYVSVASAAETVDKAKAAGGTVIMEPMDVMGAGTMAIFADPTGAVIAVWQPGNHPGAGIVNEPGSLCWNELNTRDPARAAEFYTSVFGWGTQGDESYTQWMIGDSSVGGMMMMPDMVPAEVPAHWVVYFAVADVEASVKTISDSGGTIVVPPMAVPEVGTFSLAMDPQGALFAVIQLNATAS
jgi:predicted enzyme related to lactoylglutathione lyase